MQKLYFFFFRGSMNLSFFSYFFSADNDYHYLIRSYEVCGTFSFFFLDNYTTLKVTHTATDKETIYLVTVTTVTYHNFIFNLPHANILPLQKVFSAQEITVFISYNATPYFIIRDLSY